MTRLSAPGSVLLLDHAHPNALRNEHFAASRQVLVQSGAGFGSTLGDPPSWLGGHGWECRVVDPGELSRALARPLPPVLDPARPHAPIFWLASATVPRLASG